VAEVRSVEFPSWLSSLFFFLGGPPLTFKRSVLQNTSEIDFSTKADSLEQLQRFAIAFPALFRPIKATRNDVSHPLRFHPLYTYIF
jgi:hypothetical protein